MSDDAGRDPRVRRTWTVTAVTSAVVGLGLAVVLAAGGAGGRAGLAGVLLGLSFGTAVGALYALGTTAVDALKRRPYSDRRLWIGVGLFVGSFVLTIMLAGLGG